MFLIVAFFQRDMLYLCTLKDNSINPLKHLNMKKVLSIVAVAAVMLFAGKANAQCTIRAGYQSTSVSASGDGVTVASNDGANGFYVGADYNFGLSSDNFGIAPGLVFSYHSDMMDLRIPVLFNWQEDYNAVNFGVFLGPVFNLGLAGDMYKESLIKAKRFDIAIDGGIWVGYQKIRLEFGYSYGLLNRLDAAGDWTWTFNKLFVGLGYTL